MFFFQDSKNANKPNKATTSEQLTLHGGKSSKKVVAAVSALRPELAKVAKTRFAKAARALRVKKGYSKKAAKSTKRGSAKL